MATIIDIGALVRPAFNAEDFTATKWDSAEDKAAFANSLCKFVAADFKLTLFTEKIYRRLAMTFGHIANYNKQGFVGVFFEDLRGKVDFLEQTMSWRPCGDPGWTYSDVERAIRQRLRGCDLLIAYRALRAAEIEGAERELLARLQTKFGAEETLKKAPILHCPPSPRPTASVRTLAEQTSLF